MVDSISAGTILERSKKKALPPTVLPTLFPVYRLWQMPPPLLPLERNVSAQEKLENGKSVTQTRSALRSLPQPAAAYPHSSRSSPFGLVLTHKKQVQRGRAAISRDHSQRRPSPDLSGSECPANSGCKRTGVQPRPCPEASGVRSGSDRPSLADGAPRAGPGDRKRPSRSRFMAPADPRAGAGLLGVVRLCPAVFAQLCSASLDCVRLSSLGSARPCPSARSVPLGPVSSACSAPLGPFQLCPLSSARAPPRSGLTARPDELDPAVRHRSARREGKAGRGTRPPTRV